MRIIRKIQLILVLVVTFIATSCGEDRLQEIIPIENIDDNIDANTEDEEDETNGPKMES